MAQSKVTLALDLDSFPLLSEQGSRTLINAGTSSVGDRQAQRIGILYCHNVMPSQYGLDSVGFKSEIPAISPAVIDLQDVRVIYGTARSRLYLAFTSTGAAYILLENATSWISVSTPSPAIGSPSFSPNEITIATVNGISYLYSSNNSCYQFDESTNTLVAVALNGISLANTLGIVSSAGYLIAYTENAIAWSSTIDPTDFIPSSVTGAGGGNVAGIKGKIKFVLTNSLGVLVYTDTNVVAGTYTGNAQFPFKFREVENSKGGISLDFAAYEANSAEQFVYSKAGLQAVSSRKAVTLLPEVTDFLAGRRFEDFDEAQESFTYQDVPTFLQKKIKFIASRYLVISYGVMTFTHVLVYDTLLQRLGKLKLDHADCFEYIGAQSEISKESIGFLTAGGEIKTLDFSTSHAGSGVLILGKVQVTNTRLLHLLGAELENVETDDSLSVSSRVSLDGKTTSSISPAAVVSTSEFLREYVWKSLPGKNHSLQLIGKFNLVSVILRYFRGGRR